MAHFVATVVLSKKWRERERRQEKGGSSIVKRDILNVEQRQAEEELHIIIPAS